MNLYYIMMIRTLMSPYMSANDMDSIVKNVDKLIINDLPKMKLTPQSMILDFRRRAFS